MSSAAGSRSDPGTIPRRHSGHEVLVFIHTAMQSRWNKWRHAGTSLHSAPSSKTSRQIAHTRFSDALLPSAENGKYPSFFPATSGAGAGTTGGVGTTSASAALRRAAACSSADLRQIDTTAMINAARTKPANKTRVYMYQAVASSIIAVEVRKMQARYASLWICSGCSAYIMQPVDS